jgi:hypothetical protein
MTRHPLLLAITVVDALSAALLLYAAWFAVRTLTAWAPDSHDSVQLRLERRIETAEIAARFGFGFFALASVLWVVGISQVLPPIVPGAMCGTGVIQSSQGLLNKAIWFRTLGVLAVYLWVALAKLDRRQPDSPLARVNARVLLLAAALVVVAAIVTAQACVAIDLQQPVDCCTVVYETLRQGSEGVVFSGKWLAGVYAATSLGLLGCSLWTILTGATRRFLASAVLCAALAVWLPLAALALIESFAAYYYEVLQHRCPWCLFLPEHDRVGYLLFAALLAAALEGPVALLSAKVGISHPQLSSEAHRRCRTAAVRVSVANVVFFCLAVFPAILWRLRYGVWMG